MTASAGRTWVAEFAAGSPGCRSYVYFGQHPSRGAASTAHDLWMRANCIDPATCIRLGWSFDASAGKWEMTQAEELAAEFGEAA